MSEEILKALMQLFAIIAKQDSEQFDNERLYVSSFLKKQVQPSDVDTYIKLFDEKTKEVRPRSGKKANSELTSVTDSVRILKICKRINKTLDHRQKIISTIWLTEMVSTQKKGKQRMAIINTIADVFNIDLGEFQNITNLIIPKKKEKSKNENLICIDGIPKSKKNHIYSNGLEGTIEILRIESASIYILRYNGNHELLLNGLPLTSNQCVIFNPGSAIKTPSGKPIYFSDVFEQFDKNINQDKVSFIANQISYVFDNGSYGLQKMDINEQQNSLIAIMGASGSGKSTLINVLAGNLLPSSGSIKINGIDLHKNSSELDGVIGLIPQDDLLIENLTVFENLYFNAKFCFRDLSKKELSKIVNDTLKSLGLYKIRDLAVGNSMNKLISGGQRKRLNIALELIRKPSILFVDEPTSGLSSRDSENVMDLLRELSLKGKIIFVVIHQPSSNIFKIFDKVIMLDEGGYMIQNANPVDSISYFKEKDGQTSFEQAQCPNCGNANAEQIFSIVHSEIVDEYGNYSKIRKKTPTDWHNFYLQTKKDKPINQESTKPLNNLNIPSKIMQSIIYFQRDLKSKLKNKTYLLIAFLEAPLLAFILSFIIRYTPSNGSYIFRLNENLPQYIFMSIIVAMFIGLTISAEEIFRDRKILKREAFLKLSKTAYLLAKVLILLIISAIQAFLFILIGNYILEIIGMSFSYWLVFFSIAFFSNLLGLIISSSFDEVVTIYIIIPLLIIPQMVLGGAMFSFDKMNESIVRIDKVPIIAEMMASKWAYEGLMVNQFVNNRFQKHFYKLEKAESRADFNQVYYIPELNKYLENANKLLADNDKSSIYKNTFELLQNEYNTQIKDYPSLAIQDFKNLDVKDFNTENSNQYSIFINLLKDTFNYKYSMAHTKLSATLNQYLISQKDKYYYLRNKYHNEAVSDIVTQFYEKHKIINYNNNLIQHVDAIYCNPKVESKLDFRAHLYAPQKHFFGYYFETFKFNLSIIWIMNLLLFIILRFDIIQKLKHIRLKQLNNTH